VSASGPDTGATGPRAVEVTVHAVVAGGDGLARLGDGRIVFVEGGLPGERLVVEVVEERRDHARARVHRVLEPAPTRRAPACPNVAAGCGGCSWAHVREHDQTTLAEQVVADALCRIAKLPVPEFLPPRRVPADGYRTTVTLAVGEGGRLAYHRRHGSQLVAVSSCRVAHPLVEDLVGGLRAPGWGSVTLRASVADGTRLAVLTGSGDRGRHRRRPGGAQRRGRGPRPPAATTTVEAPGDVVVVPPGGDAALVEAVAGRRWRVSARSFFQSGPAAAELLAGAVIDALGDLPTGAHLVDAYGGVGLLGGAAAARWDLRLTCVEASPSSAADARFNLADLGAGVVTGDVGRWPPTPADAVVADPARPGLGRPGVGALTATGARRLVLVSCDAASFARDAALLSGAGYDLAGTRVLGLFPDTSHLEVVSRFDRRS
jgi:23S rRNA (uracil1939-C5)-methyltransferase